MLSFITPVPATISHHTCQALPPVCNVHLVSENIGTYGPTAYKKSDDVHFDGNGWQLPLPGKSFFEVNFAMDNQVPYPHLLHIGFGQQGIGSAKMAVYVNGKLLEFNCGEDKEGIDFDITSYLVSGENTILIENSPYSAGAFSLRHIGVSITFNPFHRN